MEVKLFASVIVRNELHRYLEACIGHLLEFCDEVRILDDGSTDGWQEALHGVWGKDGRRVLAKLRARGGDEPFLTHAAARNELLQFTLDGWPSHVLSIDADEFVSDGQLVRQACATSGVAWSLEMCEVWEACEERLCVREDGRWGAHPVAMLWKPDMANRKQLVIRDRGTATGRTPDFQPRVPAAPTGAAVFHFGWARESERAARFERYRGVNDGHARAHVQSIMWPPSRVRLEGWAWPETMDGLKATLLEKTTA